MTILSTSHCSAINSHPLKTSEQATTPPAIYYSWDFVQRTKSIFSNIDIDALVNKNDSKAIEAYRDCIGRAYLINLIICDNTGKADLMFGAPRVDFGPQVMSCAEALASSKQF